MDVSLTAGWILTFGIVGLFFTKTSAQGCQTGKYGLNCNSDCPAHCSNRLCDASSGNCLQCDPGYTGKTCEQFCPVHYYGANCALQCSENCLNKNCTSVNGICIGCKPNFIGAKCEACDPTSGKYGTNCAQPCPTSCLNKKCHHIYGTCSEGCNPGFQGEKCDKVCNEGFYGPKCSESCHIQCTNRTCNHATGNCFSCRPGYLGDQCKDSCPENRFGLACLSNCSDQCMSRGFAPNCHHVTGACLLGCKEGYEGYQCLNEVNQSRFLLNTGLLINLLFCFAIFIVLLAAIARWHKIFRRRQLARISNTENAYNKMEFSPKTEPSYAEFHVTEDTQGNIKDGDYENTALGGKGVKTSLKVSTSDESLDNDKLDQKIYANVPIPKTGHS